MPYDINGYLDSLHIVWRKGTAEDPYIDKIEYPVIANQTVILTEVPDKVFRVRVSGFTEVSYEKFTTMRLAENEFYVNYSTGVVQFHKDKEAEQITVIYKARGFIQYPSDRIYHRDKLNNVVASLSNIIDESNKKIDEAEIKIEEISNVIEEAEIKISETNNATDNANYATEQAEVATEKALDAYKTTRLVFKPYVQTYNHILTNYPIPEIGWTTQVYDTAIRYRWDGIDWVAIEGFGGNIPLASEVLDGLMSTSDYKKLKDISNDVDVRTIIFVIPEDIMMGVQPPHIVFPHNGKILEIMAYVSNTGFYDTPVEVEYSNNFSVWGKLTTIPLVIESGSYVDNKAYVLSTSTINSGTAFRLNVPSNNVDAQNLQVNIKIKID